MLALLLPLFSWLGSGPAPLQEVPAPAAPRAEQAPSTKRMAERLAAIARDADPNASIYFTAPRIALFRKRVARAEGTPREADARLMFAKELMNAGRIEDALAEADRAEAVDRARPREGGRDGVMSRTFAGGLERLRILAWMRLGEVENCLGHHCCASCIAPIEAGGVHVKRRGSENAIGLLEKALARDARDYEARWLLNLAHMTLGSWPDGVPEAQRIGPERFASEHELPRFRDVAGECGLAISTIAGGVCTEDFDRDGFLDVLVCSMGLADPMHYFRSNGDGTFTERTDEAGLAGLTGGLNMIHGDYDNDGWVDVYVLRGAWYDEGGAIPDSLLRNRGDGTFEDVTEAAGLLSFHPSQTGAFADLNGDGWLDLVIGNETQQTRHPHPCEIWVSRRDGTFEEVAAQVGARIVSFVKGVAVGDFDDDGRPDVFASQRGQTCLLLRNVPDATAGGPGFKLVDVGEDVAPFKNLMSFPTWFFDYDNDGRLDLFVATNAGFSQKQNDAIGEFVAGADHNLEMPALYHNEGGRYVEVGKEAGLARSILSMGSNFGDLDNDGWLDVYLGNGAPSYAALLPNRAFRNDGRGRFQDVTTAGGFGHLQKGHGIAFADLDNDGDQDVFLEAGGAFAGDVYPNVLFENPGSANRWITLRLEGVRANRSAIGARIRVDVATPAGPRSIHVVCGTGGSFGASSLQQEIGLGDATAIERIFVRWPGSDVKQAWTGAQLDRVYRLVEGKDALEEVAVKRIELGGR